MSNAIKVAYEDLTEQIKSKKPMKKRMKRNVSSWCKGIVTDALKQVSSRVGCTVVSVNCAYTSQLDSRFGTLTGTRLGDKFTGHDGVVMHSDTNAADNVLARMGDVEIPRYMKHKDAKVILLERTRKFQEQLNQVVEVTQQVWDSFFEAIPDTDKSKTLDPKRKSTSKGNQRANYEQLTLFDFV